MKSVSYCCQVSLLLYLHSKYFYLYTMNQSPKNVRLFSNPQLLLCESTHKMRIFMLKLCWDKLYLIYSAYCYSQYSLLVMLPSDLSSFCTHAIIYNVIPITETVIIVVIQSRHSLWIWISPVMSAFSSTSTAFSRI